MMSNSTLHYTIIKEIIDIGYAPDITRLSSLLNIKKKDVLLGLNVLADYHGVVLHPDGQKIWVIHPFSLAPTNFYVQSNRGAWWGNCAWCSLGIAALLEEDVRITTTIGGESKQIEINIIDGEIKEKNYYIHFPIPMKEAWDNVIYTCSTMLIFESKEQVKKCSVSHDIPLGDIQPIERIWSFSQKWYGNHLNPNWRKWTIDEARSMFIEYELKNKIWDLDGTDGRF